MKGSIQKDFRAMLCTNTQASLNTAAGCRKTHSQTVAARRSATSVAQRSIEADSSETYGRGNAKYASKTRRLTRASSHGCVKGQRPSRRVLGIVVCMLVCIVLACSFACWNHWLRFDDAADIQGTWLVQDSDVSISFSDDEIRMSDDVSYNYELDTFSKTISFSFGDYSGSGKYRFSSDRAALTITEVNADTGEEDTTVLEKQ